MKKNSLGVFFERATLMVADQDGYSLIILGEPYIKINITYSSGKWSDPWRDLSVCLSVSIYIYLSVYIYLSIYA